MKNKVILSTQFIIISAILVLLIKIIFMLKADLLVEEAYYWNYSIHLDIGYLDHPPMVAWLIHLTTKLFGINEWGVRFSTLVCWFVTTLYSIRLSNLICKNTGWYTLYFLSILPFFFSHGLIITPDIPLTMFWSASLYYLYQAIVLSKSNYWYKAGISLGLGMLSKYTIVLMGPSILIYYLITKNLKQLLRNKAVYLCTLIAICCFSPVLYWNYQHDWASFWFQSTRRFEDCFVFNLPQFLGIFVLFTTPIGILGLYQLLKSSPEQSSPSHDTRIFLSVFLLFPLIFFMIFSVFHQIKLNWIGPSLLALMPWFSYLAQKDYTIAGFNFQKYAKITGIALLSTYILIIVCLLTGYPSLLYRALFSKVMYWQNLAKTLNFKADKITRQYQIMPTFVALDTYNIASELNFYQHKLWAQQKIAHIYPVMGGHIFTAGSLMFEYWDKHLNLKNKPLLLISNNYSLFDYGPIAIKTTINSKPELFNIPNNTSNGLTEKFYSETVVMNE